MTVFRQSPNDDFVIRLTARDRFWCKYAYQFAHELCHVLSNYERLPLAPNKWFHEALCELASMFVLKQMAKTWEAHPPYSNWAAYADSIDSYVDDLIERKESQLAVGAPLSDWFHAHELTLRNDCYQRELNRVVAIKLLPIIQASPANWQAIRYIPDTDESFAMFISLWRTACPEPHRGFLSSIADAFQIALA